MRYTLEEFGQVTDTKTGRKIPPSPIPLANAIRTQKALNRTHEEETKPKEKEEEEEKSEEQLEREKGFKLRDKADEEFEKVLAMVKRKVSYKKVIETYNSKVLPLVQQFNQYLGFGSAQETYDEHKILLDEAREERKKEYNLKRKSNK